MYTHPDIHAHSLPLSKYIYYTSKNKDKNITFSSINSLAFWHLVNDVT